MKPFFLQIAFLFTATCMSAQTISVADYGVKPNSFLDATEGVKQAIAACKLQGAKQLIFPEGRYDFWPENAEKREYFISNTSTEAECPSKIKNIGLLFENVKDITIEGNGSVFVFHGKMTTFAFDECENMSLRNVSFDFLRPSMSELTIKELHPDCAIIDIHPDSWFDIIDGKLKFYGEKWSMDRYHGVLSDTIKGTSIYSSFKPILDSKAIKLSPFSVKLEGDFSNTNYKNGHILSIRDPYRDHVGAFIQLSKNIHIENVTMHYMHGLGIVSQFSENLEYRKVKVIPSRGRSIASFADGMHFSGCKGQVLIEDCHFRGLHDDPMNVHGTYLQIRKIHSPTQVTVRFMHGQTYGFPAFYENDTIAFVAVAAIQQKGISAIRKARLTSEREMELELSDPLPKGIGIGDALENLTWTPALTVRGNRFEGTNTRGILVSTPGKVVIENNTFYRTGMYGILIATDANSWFESGAVKDVLIRNNIFEDCGYNLNNDNYAIAIMPGNHVMADKHWVNRNIRIENNIIKTFSGQIIKAKSVNGLTVKENKIQTSSFKTSDNESNTDRNGTFLLNNCTNVIIKDNDTANYPLPVTVMYSNMKKQEIKTDRKTLNLIPARD
jgi:polygalacturonase